MWFLIPPVVGSWWSWGRKGDLGQDFLNRIVSFYDIGGMILAAFWKRLHSWEKWITGRYVDN